MVGVNGNREAVERTHGTGMWVGRCGRHTGLSTLQDPQLDSDFLETSDQSRFWKYENKVGEPAEGYHVDAPQDPTVV